MQFETLKSLIQYKNPEKTYIYNTINDNDYDVHVILCSKLLFPFMDLSNTIDTKSIYDFVGNVNTHFWCCHKNNNKVGVLLFGLGELNKTQKENQKVILEGVSNVLDLVREKKKSSVVLNFSYIDVYKELLVNIMMVNVLNNYKFDFYCAQKMHLISRCDIFVSYFENLQDICNELHVSAIVSTCTNLARTLSNERADVLTPEVFNDLASFISIHPQMYHEDIKGTELKNQGLNLFYSVGQGAVNEPNLVCIKYLGKKTNQELNKKLCIALVGKGVTYDTGGLNLKPTNSIENMHLDKSGACVVLGVLKAISQTNLENVDVIGVMGMAENAIGSKAYKPFSIIKSLCGKTVKVANTDAEGRLVLADCLTYVQKEYNPDIIVDVATLTGACVSALGENCAGIFGNNPELIQEFIRIGEKKYENLFNLPLNDEHVEQLKCSEADLNSMGNTKYAGASTAAAFLSQFIDKGRKWVHLDIAGPAMRSRRNFWLNENGTGFGVQLLYEFIKEKSKMS